MYAYRPFLYLEKVALAIDSKQFKDDDLLGFAYVCALDAIKHRDDVPMRRTAELFHLSEKEFIERGAQAACAWLKVPSVDNL